MTVALLIVSALGCLLIWHAPRGGVREIAGATLAVAPVIALIALALLR